MPEWRTVRERIAAAVDARLPDACLLCDAPAGGIPNLCPACVRHLSALRMHARTPLIAYAYAPPIATLVRWMKFDASLSAARTLGALLAEAVVAAHARLPDALVPVPLHPRRLRERRFNQAVELARPVSRRVNRPLLLRACRRVRATRAQSGLADLAGRRRNVAGAFHVDGSLAHLRRVAIVDDVLTTGATVEALAAALRAAGVRHVLVWVCAGRAARDATRPDWTPTGRCSR